MLKSFNNWLNEGHNINGEYWIISGSVDFADGDVGDRNHEGIAIEAAQREIIDVTDYDGKYDDNIDWDEFKLYLCKEQLEQEIEGNKENESSLRERYNDDPNYFLDDAIKNYNFNQELWNVADGYGDARKYAIEKWGWIAVRGNNIELYGYNEKNRRSLEQGLGDILDQEGIHDDDDEGEEVEYSIYDYKTGKSFDLTWENIQKPFAARPKQPATTKGHSKFLVNPPDSTENLPQTQKSAIPSMIPKQLPLWTSESFKHYFESQINFPFHSDHDQSEIEFKDKLNKRILSSDETSNVEEIIENYIKNEKELYYILDLNKLQYKKFAFPHADPIIVVYEQKPFIIEWDKNSFSTKDAYQWISDIGDNAWKYVGERDFNKEFWEGVAENTVVYHATPEENKQSILKNGLEPRCETRGISNRHMGCAVFASFDKDQINSYGNLIISILIGKMKKDGYMPRVSGEEPLQEDEDLIALAHKIEIEYETDSHSWEGLSPDTIAIYNHIPAKYLKIN